MPRSTTLGTASCCCSRHSRRSSCSFSWVSGRTLTSGPGSCSLSGAWRSRCSSTSRYGVLGLECWSVVFLCHCKNQETHVTAVCLSLSRLERPVVRCDRAIARVPRRADAQPAASREHLRRVVERDDLHGDAERVQGTSRDQDDLKRLRRTRFFQVERPTDWLTT